MIVSDCLKAWGNLSSPRENDLRAKISQKGEGNAKSPYGKKGSCLKNHISEDN
jgi:hypothetical protein